MAGESVGKKVVAVGYPEASPPEVTRFPMFQHTPNSAEKPRKKWRRTERKEGGGKAKKQLFPEQHLIPTHVWEMIREKKKKLELMDVMEEHARTHMPRVIRHIAYRTRNSLKENLPTVAFSPFAPYTTFFGGMPLRTVPNSILIFQGDTDCISAITNNHADPNEPWPTGIHYMLPDDELI